MTVAQVDDKVRLQKVETWFDPLEMFRQIAPNGIVNKEVKPVAQVDPLNGGKAEDVADSLAKARPPKESLVKEIAKETHSGPKLQDDQEAKLDAKIEALVNAALEPIVDARVQAIIDAKVKAVVDAKLEAIFTSEKRANLEQNVKTKVTPLAAEGINNPSENTAVEAEDGTEASPVRDKLETLEPLKKDSTGLPNDESTTLSKDKTQSTAGNALAAAPDSEETRQVHEEMSKISAAECPFLMNKE